MLREARVEARRDARRALGVIVLAEVVTSVEFREEELANALGGVREPKMVSGGIFSLLLPSSHSSSVELALTRFGFGVRSGEGGSRVIRRVL